MDNSATPNPLSLSLFLSKLGKVSELSSQEVWTGATSEKVTKMSSHFPGQSHAMAGYLISLFFSSLQVYLSVWILMSIIILHFVFAFIPHVS